VAPPIYLYICDISIGDINEQRNNMKQSKVYLLLCVVGVAVPWIFLFGFLGDDQASVPLFFTSIFANHVSSAVAGDLIISALAFIVFVFIEGRRIGLKNLWIYIPATLFVGLSFGLPLFLYHRARLIEKGL
jgi:hypothetical protein